MVTFNCLQRSAFALVRAFDAGLAWTNAKLKNKRTNYDQMLTDAGRDNEMLIASTSGPYFANTMLADGFFMKVDSRS